MTASSFWALILGQLGQGRRRRVAALAIRIDERRRYMLHVVKRLGTGITPGPTAGKHRYLCEIFVLGLRAWRPNGDRDSIYGHAPLQTVPPDVNR